MLTLLLFACDGENKDTAEPSGNQVASRVQRLVQNHLENQVVNLPIYTSF